MAFQPASFEPLVRRVGRSCKNGTIRGYGLVIDTTTTSTTTATTATHTHRCATAQCWDLVGRDSWQTHFAFLVANLWQPSVTVLHTHSPTPPSSRSERCRASLARCKVHRYDESSVTARDRLMENGNERDVTGEASMKIESCANVGCELVGFTVGVCHVRLSANEPGRGCHGWCGVLCRQG